MPFWLLWHASGYEARVLLSTRRVLSHTNHWVPFLAYGALLVARFPSGNSVHSELTITLLATHCHPSFSANNWPLGRSPGCLLFSTYPAAGQYPRTGHYYRFQPRGDLFFSAISFKRADRSVRNLGTRCFSMLPYFP